MSPTLKSTGGGVTLGPNLGVFPLEQTLMLGVPKSEHRRLRVHFVGSESRPACLEDLRAASFYAHYVNSAAPESHWTMIPRQLLCTPSIVTSHVDYCNAVYVM